MPGGLSDCLERNLGLEPWGISAKEVTQPAAMWAPAERGSYSGHLVLTDDPVAKVGDATLQEDQYGAAATTYKPFSQSEGWSHSCERRSQHNKALHEAREAHKQALEAAHPLELDIERLSQGAWNVQCQCPCSHSDSCLQSKSLIDRTGPQADAGQKGM